MQKAAKAKGVKIAFVFHPTVALALREVVADNRLSLSGFVESAVTRALRNYRPAMEFIAAGREKAGKSFVKGGGIDPKLDRLDGIPLAVTSFTERNWRENWKSDKNPWQTINLYRQEQGREMISDSEKQSVIKHMGCEPGGGK